MGSPLKFQSQASVQIATASSGELINLTPYSAATDKLFPWSPQCIARATLMAQSHVTSLEMSALVVLQTKVSGEGIYITTLDITLA